MFYKMAYFSYSLILAICTGLNIFDPKLQSQTQVVYRWLLHFLVIVFYLGLERGMVFFFKGHFAHRIYQKRHIEKIG